MESNRDEAERCIEIAAQALRDSKMEKAEKFLNKAEKLFPTQKAKGNNCFFLNFGYFRRKKNLGKVEKNLYKVQAFYKQIPRNNDEMLVYRFIRESVEQSQR